MENLKVGDKILYKVDGEIYEIKEIMNKLYDPKTFEEVTMLIVPSHKYDGDFAIRYSEENVEKVDGD